MDKQARLTAIDKAIKESQESIIQAEYNAAVALRSKEYSFLKRNAEVLEYMDIRLRELNAEAKSLRDDIESESREFL